MRRLFGLRNMVGALGYLALYWVLALAVVPRLLGAGGAGGLVEQIVPVPLMATVGALLPAFIVGVLAGRLGSLGGGLPGWLGLGVLTGLGPLVLSFLVAHSYPHLPGVGWQTYALSVGTAACCVAGAALGHRLRRRGRSRAAGAPAAPAPEA